MNKFVTGLGMFLAEIDWLTLLTSPFAIGFGLGLAACAYVLRIGLLKRGLLRNEIKSLKLEVDASRQHLDQHLKLNAKGVSSLESESKALREENLGLKEALSAYKQKLSGQERRALIVYDTAVRKLSENAPGFAGAWESCFREAEAQVDKSESGIAKWVNRLVRPSLSVTNAPFSSLSDNQQQVFSDSSEAITDGNSSNSSS